MGPANTEHIYKMYKEHIYCHTDLDTEAAGPINTEQVYTYICLHKHTTHTHTRKKPT